MADELACTGKGCLLCEKGLPLVSLEAPSITVRTPDGVQKRVMISARLYERLMEVGSAVFHARALAGMDLTIKKENTDGTETAAQEAHSAASAGCD